MITLKRRDSERNPPLFINRLNVFILYFNVIISPPRRHTLIIPVLILKSLLRLRNWRSRAVTERLIIARSIIRHRRALKKTFRFKSNDKIIHRPVRKSVLPASTARILWFSRLLKYCNCLQIVTKLWISERQCWRLVQIDIIGWLLSYTENNGKF